ncbi:hypothetical protein [Nocardioides sp. YR527]|uniref:hypothetical protein n=1 Tax=Nocardioides sp. YR527 TaxID=1881028 RepID=UPI0015A0F46F|nr:hypothetical protein [Nocardioides sp. YR527]
MTAGIGLRFGEVTALWVSDVDLCNRTVRVSKAWKRVGENGETEIPSWLKKQVRDKHTMREHYLGNPKTPKSRRTVSISPGIAAILEKLIEGKAANDFVFVSAAPTSGARRWRGSRLTARTADPTGRDFGAALPGREAFAATTRQRCHLEDGGGSIATAVRHGRIKPVRQIHLIAPQP